VFLDDNQLNLYDIAFTRSAERNLTAAAAAAAAAADGDAVSYFSVAEMLRL
jgi:hypothetical protein